MKNAKAYAVKHVSIIIVTKTPEPAMTACQVGMEIHVKANVVKRVLTKNVARKPDFV
jgi:hypothetical protein